MYNGSENIRLERKYKKYVEFIEYKNIYKKNNKLYAYLSKESKVEPQQ